MEELATLPELDRLKLREHQPLRRCPKCGTRSRRLPRWLLLLLGIDSTAFHIVWCQGGAEPSKTMQTPAICAGIPHDHLHWICRMCNYTTLMKVRS